MSYASAAMAAMDGASRVNDFVHNPNISRYARRGFRGAARTVTKFRRNVTHHKPKKRKRRSNHRLKDVGSQPMSCTSHKHKVDDQDNLDIQSKYLYTDRIIKMGKYSGTGGILNNQRLSDTVTVTGIKICLHIMNKRNIPGYFNIALLQQKSASFADIKKGFFSNDGRNVQDRTIDFDSSLSGLNLDCMPISKDKNILIMRKRFKIGPKNNVSGDDTYAIGASKNWMDFQTYIPINRQFR